MWPCASLPLEGWAAHRTGCMLRKDACLRRPCSSSHFLPTPSKGLLPGWPNVSHSTACSLSPSGLSGFRPYSKPLPPPREFGVIWLHVYLWYKKQKKGHGWGEKGRVPRTRSEGSKIVSSPAWFRLVGSWTGQTSWDLPESWMAPVVFTEAESCLSFPHPASHTRTAQPIPPLLPPVSCSLLSALFWFDILKPLPLPSAHSRDTVCWHLPSQFPGDCLSPLRDATSTSGLFTSLPDVLPWTIYLGFPAVTW